MAKPKQKRRSWTRHLKRKRAHKDKRISILKLSTGLAPTLIGASEAYTQNGNNLQATMATALQPDGIVDDIVYQNTGLHVLSGFSFDPMILLRNVGIWGAGYLGSSLANRFGVNREMKKIPIVGKIIKL